MRKFILSGGCMILALSLLNVEVGAGKDAVDISGSWKVNEELSDKPGNVLAERIKKMQESRPGKGMRGPGAGGRGGGRGGGYGGGRGGGRGEHPSGGPGQHKAMMSRVEEMQKLLVDVEIVQVTGEIRMISASGDTTTFIPDGVERKKTTAMGETRVTAFWEDLELVTTWEPVRGPQVRRVFRIDDEGRLEMKMRFVAGRMPDPVEFAVVYDSAGD